MRHGGFSKNGTIYTGIFILFTKRTQKKKKKCVIFVLCGSIIQHWFRGTWSHYVAFCSNFHENMDETWIKQECPEIP